MPPTIPSIKLDHVAVAAEQVRDILPRYAHDLSGEQVAAGEWSGFNACQLQFANLMRLELLEPARPEQNDFLRRFIGSNGPGAHHITFKVKGSFLEALEIAAGAGYPVIGVNADDEFWKEAFIHPKAAHGIVVQLAQSAADYLEPAGVLASPAWMPPPRSATPASLNRIVHSVADLDAASALFGTLLNGQPVERGRGVASFDDDAEWIDFAWEGPGRIRLAQPSTHSSAMGQWIGDRSGRLHHLEFSVEMPESVGGATALPHRCFVVPPEINGNVRLVLTPKV